MSPSNIEWTEETWNPTTGCTKVSPGCANCYAETLTKRYAGAKGWPAEFRPWTPANEAENVVLHPDRLEAPLHWRTPRRVFVDSMADLFHERVPDEYIDRVFAVMALTPQHTYQVLTKRPERMREYTAQSARVGTFWEIARRRSRGELEAMGITDVMLGQIQWPLPNVWLGVTVENQRWADERIPILLDTPAAVRFISAEPLLEAVSLRSFMCNCGAPQDDGYHLAGCVRAGRYVGNGRVESKPGLDWVIIGGESGPKHRPFDAAWARSIVAQCRGAGVACFVKQLGGSHPGTKLEDLPEDLRVREYPRC